MSALIYIIVVVVLNTHTAHGDQSVQISTDDQDNQIKKRDGITLTCRFTTDNPNINATWLSISKDQNDVLCDYVPPVTFTKEAGSSVAELKCPINSVYKTTNYTCKVQWGKKPDIGGDRSSVSHMTTVNVCCPLYLERTSNIKKIAMREYGLDVTVSGDDVGSGHVRPAARTDDHDAPLHVSVKKKVINGPKAFNARQSSASEFDITWWVNLPKAGSCWKLDTWNHKYELKVSEENSPADLRVPFEVQYPAQWNGEEIRDVDLPLHNNQSVTLRCDVCSHPKAELTWTLCGSDLPDNVIAAENNAKITIPEVTADHVGTYECKATNEINNNKWSETFEFKVLIDGIKINADCLPIQSAVHTTDSHNVLTIALVVSGVLLVVVLCYFIWKKCWNKNNTQGDQDTPDWMSDGGAPHREDPPHRPDVTISHSTSVRQSVTLVDTMIDLRGVTTSESSTDPATKEAAVLYAEIGELKSSCSEGSPVIHDSENRTTYAKICHIQENEAPEYAKVKHKPKD